MQPEVELLLCCARTSINPETGDRLRVLLQQNINWQHLLKLARRHGVMPLLYWILNDTCPGAIPDDTMTKLREHFHDNARRSLFLTVELVRLLNLFASQNIPAIPFKGPVLATSAYGNLSLRQFSDLDILVRESDINKAKELFLAQGYKMKIERIRLSEEQEAAFVRSPHIYKLVRECAYPFINLKIGIMAELHWAVMPKHFSLAIDSEQLWDNLELVAIAGTTVSNLSPENTLLLICGHGTKDCWIQLNRICDVAELIRSHPQLDWERLIEKATLLGSERILWLGLFLAKQLLGTSLPESVWQRIQADPLVEILAAQIQEGLCDETEKFSSIGRLSSFHLQVRERLGHKIQYCLRAAITPTTSDWLLLPLVRFPAWLYYLIRPIRLVKNYVVRQN
ncbi:MAG TPA: hypothetical protein DDZ80_19065 [Cyanobacteria bacterium UBA8803]|nr:hypothetical protein [Cyanobacteria bacterium UBA9273]HBL60474.1 hypothetical protein [Cyanobacteria bacterium UBA8803]